MNADRGPWWWWAWLAALAVVLAALLLLAGDARSHDLATNTIRLAGATATASVLIGAPLAFLISRTDVVGRRAAGVALLGLLFLPLYLQAAAWQAGFGVQGWFTLAVGGPPLLDDWRGAIAIHTLAAIPWVVLIVGVGLRLTEPELEEEALLDGSPRQVFRRVTLRRASESLIVAFLWVAVATASEMTVTDLFQIRTYAEEIYTQFALGDTLQTATWNLLPSIVATAWVIAAGLFVVGRLIPPDRQATWKSARVFRLGSWRIAASAAVMVVVGALVIVPLGSLVVKAGAVVERVGDGFVRTWSFEQCAAMVFGSPLEFSREFGWTLSVGALAATTAIALGLPLAWMARRGGWRAAPAWLTVAVCLAIPGPLAGLALIAVFNSTAWPLAWLYDHSIAPIWIAQVIRALPLATLVLWYALRTVEQDLLASATLDGASGMTRFFRIVLPQRVAAVAAAWLVAFAIATGELDASILVVPPGVITLPIQVFGLIHYGVDDRVAGISLFVMAVFFAVAGAMAVIARRAARER